MQPASQPLLIDLLGVLFKMPFEFAPVFADFTLGFAGPPSLTVSTWNMVGQTVKRCRAELSLGHSGFEGAEFHETPGWYCDGISEQEAMRRCLARAKSEQLLCPAFEWNPVAKRASVRGDLFRVGADGAVRLFIAEAHTYYGSNSLLDAYTGIPAELYPTPEIIRFFGSVRPLASQTVHS